MKQQQREHRQELAQQLYVNGHQTQKEIAVRIGVSLPTINRWAQKGKWKELKAGKAISKEGSLKRLYDQVNHLTDEIDKREKKYPTPAEADTLNKLATAIKKIENDDVNVHMTYQVFTKYMTWLGQQAIDKEDRAFLGLVIESTKAYLHALID